MDQRPEQTPPSSSFTNVTLAGVRTALLSRDETTRIMIEAVRHHRAGRLDRPLFSSSMNGQTIFEADQSPETQALFNAFDLVNMDGQPAVLMSRLWPTPFPERVATTDLIHDVLAAGRAESVRHYLLGASPEVLAKARAEVARLHPDAIICGAHHGYVEREDLPAIVEDIKANRAEILWICMGVPKEQILSLELKAMLGSHIAVLKTGGGVLDFLSGTKPRAPAIMQKIGIEWIFRLGLEPRRLFDRYWRSSPRALRILLQTRPRYEASPWLVSAPAHEPHATETTGASAMA